MRSNYPSAENGFSGVDCLINFTAEKIPGNGEDSYAFFANKKSGMVGVFDGCGGSGARNYAEAKGKTGAYIASRVVAGAAMQWAKDTLSSGTLPDNSVSLKAQVDKALKVCRDRLYVPSSFKGSISKDFPTTMAMSAFVCQSGTVHTVSFWAGDSRCYLLCENGLFQLTEDDLGGIDAMANLTSDGVLTNVITATEDYSIHAAGVDIKKPCVLFAATDGCFGYLRSPMEFEFLLLDTLHNSASVSEWEECMKAALLEVAGDDYTLSGAVINFGSFAALKSALMPRRQLVLSSYIENEALTPAQQWEEYKKQYYKICER